MTTPGARNAKQYRADIAAGRRRVIPADEIRPHLATLEGAGWTGQAIAETAGVAPATVTRLRRGVLTKVTAPVGEAILAIDPTTLPNVAPTRLVSKVGTVRRIQALMRMGWPAYYLREQTGIHITMVCGTGSHITRAAHDRMAALYRELSHRRGPSARTAAYALKRGYPGPADWDDIDHDTAPEREDEAS